MNTFISWLKNALSAIITSTILLLIFKYVSRITFTSLRIVLIYIVVFIFINILWLIKIKNIKFSMMNFSMFIGMFCWGIIMGTLMNIIINNPFELHNMVVNYIVFMLGGFIWGIATYLITNKIEKKKRIENNKMN